MAGRKMDTGAYPVCGSREVEGWEVTFEGGLAIQECTCCACDSAWNDVYEICDRVVARDARP